MLSALAALGAACWGGFDREEAIQSLTDDRLAVMVLPKEELGEAAVDLPLDSEPAETGFQDNEVAAADTPDPDDTAADLSQGGRLNGYELSYSDYTRLGQAEGVVEVETAVELYRDGEAASAALAEMAADLQGRVGQESSAGYLVEDAEWFFIEGIGDQARVIRYRFSVEGATGHATVVAFRLGRLVGTAGLVRNEETKADALVQEIAGALEERIEGVLRGDIKAPALPPS